MTDFASSISVLVLLGALLALYAARVVRAGRARDARVEREGGGPLVGQAPMEMAYWALSPLGRLCNQLGIRAAWVTYGSLAFGAGAALSIGSGHYGIGALLATFGFLGDALDGMVARLSGSASARGELLDATVDRIIELLIFGGLAVSLRASIPLLVLTLLASAGAVMVSHATAKAEALGVTAPRGIMRRTERATILTAALLVTPLVEHGAPRYGTVPLIIALALIGVLANVSALQRLASVSSALDAGARKTPRAGLLVFVRHQAAALLGTVVDFATMTTLVELGLAGPVAATGCGAAVGGTLNFLVGRHWVFDATTERPQAQALRYVFVSVTSLIFNMAGEHLSTGVLHTNYVIGRIVTALLVATLWNYPMQRAFVFRPRELS